MNGQSLLVAEFQKRRERNPNFSLRSFARWLDVSPAQVSQVMSGKRPVTFAVAERMAERFSLSPSERRALLSQVIKRKQTSSAQSLGVPPRTPISEDSFRLISDWHHLAILSLTKIPGARPDPRWISRRLGISSEEANSALQRLCRIGVLELTPKFKQIGNPFEVASDTPSEAIRRYHHAMLNLASEKIDTVSNQHRQLQSISIPVDPSLLAKFKVLIDEFLDEATELAQRGSPSEVYNLNVQLVPATLIEDTKGPRK